MANTETVISPIGNILFMALAKPIKNQQGDGELYTIKLEFDGADVEALSFSEQLKSINSAKIVTKDVEKEGNYKVSFNSMYQVKVLDASGNRIKPEDLPRFYSKTDSGRARVEGTVSRKGVKPTVYLKAVQLLELNLADREGTEVELKGLEKLIKTMHSPE